MKLLLDTNIILDALQERAPFDVAAKELLRRGQKGEVVAVTHETCLSAMNLTIQDFEDALVVVCAENVMADYIITRDEKLLGCESGVPLMRPQDVLDKLSER
ncbi:MAG: PIN domain-containing protein [Fusobacteriaceae bacterium]|jgi:predicted nucleic acid-binding protein|nr:PIN domain-containing protein [Fusobacteriaceae bacterium]